MITDVELAHLGSLNKVAFSKLGAINLVLGGNGSGKTFLLKAMYASLKALEGYKRGAEYKSFDDLLVEKLHWTFQAEKIGDLVTKGQTEDLIFTMKLDKQRLIYSFDKKASSKIGSVHNPCAERTSNSIFLPAKEVLSLHPIIKKTREDDKVFGFDNTYYELAQVLDRKTTQGNNAAFADARKQLEKQLGGRLKTDEHSATNKWYFKQGNHRYPMGVTSEGIKKLAILDTLLGNGYLSKGSIVFIDEPESGLHPKAIAKLLDIILILSETGIQFFMATHSYFVVQKLYLLSLQHKVSIPCLSLNDDGTFQQSDFIEGMPDNDIIDESVELYKQSIGIAP